MGVDLLQFFRNLKLNTPRMAQKRKGPYILNPFSTSVFSIHMKKVQICLPAG
jgi:hypothetical protein